MKSVSIGIQAFALLMLAMAVPVHAQTPYPDHAISIVVAYPPGGYVDSFARPVAEKLGKILGQSVVVINRPGAGGMIGAGSVMRAKPDGYTLMIHIASAMAIYSATTAEKPDPNFPPLTIAATIASTPGVMTVASALGVSSFKDMVAKIKAEPGKHSYGSAGVGTPSHFWSAQIVRDLGLDILHVPYGGGAPALMDVMAGRIAWMFDTPAGSSKAIQSGKATPVVVAAPARLRDLPNVPAAHEVGFPQLSEQMSTLFLAAPAGTPREILVKLNAAYTKALQDPDLRARIADTGSIIPEGRTDVDGATALATKEYGTWFETAKASGIRTQ